MGSRAIALRSSDAELFAHYARSGSDGVTASKAPLRFRPHCSELLLSRLESIFELAPRGDIKDGSPLGV